MTELPNISVTFLHFYIPARPRKRAARAVRALCGRCVRDERARVSASACEAQAARGRVPPPRPVGLYRPARGAVSPSGRGRSPTRRRERGASRPSREHAAGAERARAHEGEGRSDRTSRRSKGEGTATGAPAGAEGGGYPSGRAETAPRSTTRAHHGCSGLKFHCRTTLRQRHPKGAGRRVYKRKHPQCMCIYKCEFTFVKAGGQGAGATTAPAAPTRKPSRPTERDKGRSGATPQGGRPEDERGRTGRRGGAGLSGAVVGSDMPACLKIIIGVVYRIGCQ